MFFQVALDAARAIDDGWMQGGDGSGDIAWMETAGTGNGVEAGKTNELLPGEDLAGATGLAADFGVEQVDIWLSGFRTGLVQGGCKSFNPPGGRFRIDRDRQLLPDFGAGGQFLPQGSPFSRALISM